jgi:hypothetical protein
VEAGAEFIGTIMGKSTICLIPQNLCSPARMKLILKIYEKEGKENKC